MSFVLEPPALPSVAVAGRAERFAVRRILCVGRNYAAHAREMGKDPGREPPFFFTKPADAVVEDGASIPYPPATADLHFEGELVVALGAGGRDVPEAAALDLVWGYAVGNDLTRRDLQAEAKAMGRPWDLAKGFDLSAPIGAIRPVAEVGHPARGRLVTRVNGAVRQDGDLAEMIWAVPEIISFLSRSVALRPGDLVMTGTPAGVGALVPGDVCEVEIDGIGRLTTRIAAPAPDGSP